MTASTDTPALFALADTTDDAAVLDRERRVALVVAAFRQWPQWPVDADLDRQTAQRLIDTFPRMDLPTVITAWCEWMTEHTTRKAVHPRARLVTWCTRERQRPTRPRSGPGAGGVRPGPGGTVRTAPRSAAEFGDLPAQGLASWG